MKQWRTFEDFVKHAHRCYGGDILSYEEIEQFILDKLTSKRLSPTAVVCYINWCDNGFFTQEEIATQFRFTREAVKDHLYRLRRVWPFLPGHPHARGQRDAKERIKEFGKMTRLKKKVEAVAKVRVTW